MIAAFEIPVKLVSEANSHRQFWYRAKRAKEQREKSALATRTALSGLAFRLPLIVVITRVSPRELDSDNVTSSAKHVRDGIADALGVDDRDGRVIWRVTQERGAPKQYAARVLIRETTYGAHYCERCAVDVGGER